MMKAIKVPKGLILNPQKMARAIKNGMDAEAKRVESDLAATVQTWDNPAEFTITSSGPYTRRITTTHAVWVMLNKGTRPHIIRPKNAKVLTWMGNNYRAKTRAGQLKSLKGGNNNTIVYAKEVQHPGTEAREWNIAAADKSKRFFAATMQRAIDAELT